MDRPQIQGLAMIACGVALFAALPLILQTLPAQNAPGDQSPIDWTEHSYSVRPDGWLFIKTGEFREAYDRAERIQSMILYPHGEMGDSATASVVLSFGQAKQRMDFRTVEDARALIEFVLENHPKSQ